MYPRLLQPPPKQSFFLFGPRGVGKTAWVRNQFPDALFFDLLDHQTYTQLLAAPQRLGDQIPQGYKGWVVVDEVQRVPELLNEVHRLIESRRLRFVLTGSSARKLRRRGVNLLAGRALTRHMHPLTALELGVDFDLKRALRWGCLPLACTSEKPQDYLNSYAATYLREEVQQEGFVRNIGAFSRFLEAASFSQGSLLNMAAVSRECAVSAKVVEDYFSILEDLLIAVRLPVFTKRAKRRLITHPKFYYFDAGVFQAIRPRGPLDAPEEIHGAALETLFLQEARAINDYKDLGYQLYYWRTATGDEVDFVLYGERGLCAFEVKMARNIRADDLRTLQRFRADFPRAKMRLLYLGDRRWHDRGIEVVPFVDCITHLDQWL
ncbi:MAG: ATPase [Omnitrophica WOR_2 bacterium RIFCSPHIGHO2_02_FULL_52_10]|nr:MAG: ATPase [Omnitrophica WOR_2 bacterium RIFCSPHIGHO2_02_FULL_52_10]